MNYFETCPQLVKSKFEKFDGDSTENKKIWEKLVGHLNSLGYGQRSTNKWQLAIGRWKSKVKGKATAIKIDMERTGGGPSESPPLTDLEERLLAILDWKSVYGDQNKEFGIEKSVATTAESSVKRAIASESEEPKDLMHETLNSSNGVDAITTSLNKNVSPLMPTLNFFKKNENQININRVRPKEKKRKEKYPRAHQKQEKWSHSTK